MKKRQGIGLAMFVRCGLGSWGPLPKGLGASVSCWHGEESLTQWKSDSKGQDGLFMPIAVVIRRWGEGQHMSRDYNGWGNTRCMWGPVCFSQPTPFPFSVLSQCPVWGSTRCWRYLCKWDKVPHTQLQEMSHAGGMAEQHGDEANYHGSWKRGGWTVGCAGNSETKGKWKKQWKVRGGCVHTDCYLWGCVVAGRWSMNWVQRKLAFLRYCMAKKNFFNWTKIGKPVNNHWFWALMYLHSSAFCIELLFTLFYFMFLVFIIFKNKMYIFIIIHVYIHPIMYTHHTWLAIISLPPRRWPIKATTVFIARTTEPSQQSVGSTWPKNTYLDVSL